MEELENRVSRDDFTAILLNEQRLRDSFCASGTNGEEETKNLAANADTKNPCTGNEVLQPEWWDAVPVPGARLTDTTTTTTSSTTIEEDTGEYIVVEHSDAVDALAAFLAAYLVSLPEAQAMTPAQLQAAMRQSLKEIRKGKVRKLWDWGRFLYRAAAMSYGAFAAYTNPWIAEAVLRGLFTCARFARNFW